MKQNLAETIVKALNLQFKSAAERTHFIALVAKTIKKKQFIDPILPKSGESMSVSIMTPKIAALAFDRVYRLPFGDPVPTSVGFYGATDPEIIFWVGGITTEVALQLGIPGIRIVKGPVPGEENTRKNMRYMFSDYPRLFGTMPTIFYDTIDQQSQDFPQGSHQVLTSAIHNIALVNENDLAWEQVLEFRRDTQARIKYRRLVRWIDIELVTQSPAIVEDLIATRLDDYEWALKKHGIRTMLGALSCLLDPKFLIATSTATAATSVVGGTPWAALCAATLVIGKSALSFGAMYIDSLDEQRKSGYELAYLHEIKNEFGKSPSA